MLLRGFELGWEEKGVLRPDVWAEAEFLVVLFGGEGGACCMVAVNSLLVDVFFSSLV